MYIVVIFTLVAILFTYLESIGKMYNGMTYGFVLVTILGCIHYNYGNDYCNYYQMYNQLSAQGVSIPMIFRGEARVYVESGWLLLNFVFQHLGGFFVLVAFLNIFQNWVFYRFIRDNVHLEWRVMAVFIYLCYTSLYLMNFSMMRQGLAAAIFLAVWPLIKEKKFIPAFIIIILTSYIHKSAFVLIPFVFWGYIPFNKGKLIAIFYAVLFITIWISSSFVSGVISRLMILEPFGNYMAIYGNDEFTSKLGIGFVLKTIPFFIALYYLYTNTYDDNNERALCSLGILFFFLTPFSMRIPLIGRLGVYFTVYSIAAIPICYRSISNIHCKRLFVVLYVISTAYDYLIFFKNPTWVENYTDFHTIFDVL